MRGAEERGGGVDADDGARMIVTSVQCCFRSLGQPKGVLSAGVQKLAGGTWSFSFDPKMAEIDAEGGDVVSG